MNNPAMITIAAVIANVVLLSLPGSVAHAGQALAARHGAASVPEFQYLEEASGREVRVEEDALVERFVAEYDQNVEGRNRRRINALTIALLDTYADAHRELKLRVARILARLPPGWGSHLDADELAGYQRMLYRDLEGQGAEASVRFTDAVDRALMNSAGLYREMVIAPIETPLAATAVIDAMLKVVADFPHSEYVPHAQYRLAQVYQERALIDVTDEMSWPAIESGDLKGDLELSLAVLGQIVERAGDDSESQQAIYARYFNDALYRAALTHLLLRDYESAERALSRIHEAHPHLVGEYLDHIYVDRFFLVPTEATRSSEVTGADNGWKTSGRSYNPDQLARYTACLVSVFQDGGSMQFWELYSNLIRFNNSDYSIVLASAKNERKAGILRSRVEERITDEAVQRELKAALDDAGATSPIRIKSCVPGRSAGEVDLARVRVTNPDDGGPEKWYGVALGDDLSFLEGEAILRVLLSRRVSRDGYLTRPEARF